MRIVFIMVNCLGGQKLANFQKGSDENLWLYDIFDVKHKYQTNDFRSRQRIP